MWSVISSKTFAIAGTVLALTATTADAFDVIGHRGARGLRPDNTLSGFIHAADLGATAVEVDVTLTKDLHVIARHDLRVGNCTGGYANRYWKNLRLEQVRRLDCGAARIPGQMPVPGSHVPLLSQVYRAVPLDVVVEVKRNAERPRETFDRETIARRVVKTIRQARGVRRTTVQSFDWGLLREIGRRAPQLRLQGLANDLTMHRGSRWLGGIKVRRRPFDSGLASAADRAGLDALALPMRRATDKQIFSAHQRGLAVTAYTIDAPSKMDALIARGVDGIITDHPDRLVRAVARTSVN